MGGTICNPLLQNFQAVHDPTPELQIGQFPSLPQVIKMFGTNAAQEDCCLLFV